MKENKIRIDYIVLICLFAVLHIFMRFIAWDDPYYLTAWEKYDFNMVELLSYVYTRWSSRIVIEAVTYVVGYLPKFIWKIADTFFVLLFYINLVKLAKATANTDENQKKNVAWLSLLFFLCWPFSTQGTTGWLSSTMNTLWVVTCMLTVFLYIYQIYFLDKKLKLYQYILLLLCLCYAVNHESASPVMICTLIFLIWFMRKKTFENFTIYLCLAGSIVGFLVAALCPGNSIRLHGSQNKVGYLSLSFFSKMRMAVNTEFYHFMSVPNSLLFIFCLLLAMCIFKKYKNKWCRVLGVIPVVIDLCWSAYFMLIYTIGTRSLTYRYPDEYFIEYGLLEQGLAMFSAIVLLVTMGICIALLTNQKLLAVFILLVGQIPIAELGLTPAISASILRTAIYPYISFMILMIAIKNQYINTFAKYQIKIIYILGIGGGLLNILQVVRHMYVYG